MMDGRCDFCPRPGRPASCRCPNGHADVGAYPHAEKHEPWLNSVEIACRQCEGARPSRIVALYETTSAALVAEVEQQRVRVRAVRDAWAKAQDHELPQGFGWPGDLFDALEAL